MASVVIEDAVLQRPVGSRVTVESEGGWHLIEVLKESEPVKAAGAPQPPPPRVRVQSVNVMALGGVLADPSQVRDADPRTAHFTHCVARRFTCTVRCVRRSRRVSLLTCGRSGSLSTPNSITSSSMR